MKHMLQDMTFQEFRARMDTDPVIILPFGSVETQGPRAPMGDFMLSTEMARRVGERTGAIVAPTMPFGVAESFRSVPGGMQVRGATFRALLTDMIGAFLDHGIERIVLFNGHTGNHAPIGEVTQQIRRERGVIVPWMNIWPMVSRDVLVEAFGEHADHVSGHGASIIASVYEALLPGVSDLGGNIPPEPQRHLLGLPTSGLGTIRQADVDVFIPMQLADHCAAVVGGDASLSNPRAGQVVADFIMDRAVALVEHMKTAPVHASGQSQPA